MAEVLSQNEIDALLAAVSTGDVNTEEATAREQKSFIAYDLTSQEKSVRGKLYGLEGIHDRFARHMRVSLSTLLKKPASVKVNPAEYVKFSDYMANILLPASLNIIELEGFKAHIIMVVSSKLAYALVDAYFGGSERPFSKIGGKDQFTVIENKMIKKVCETAVSDLEESWRLNHPVKMKLLRSEGNPQFIGCIQGNESVAVVNMDVEFESLSGPMSLVIQLRPLEPIQSSLAINMTELSVGGETEWSHHWLRELMEIELNCRVNLGETAARVNQVQKWKNGDVIGLTQGSTSALDVKVEGLTKFRGLMGVFHGNNAIRLTESPGKNKKEE